MLLEQIEKIIDKVDLAQERLDLHEDRLNEIEAVLEQLLYSLQGWYSRKDL